MFRIFETGKSRIYMGIENNIYFFCDTETVWFQKFQFSKLENQGYIQGIEKNYFFSRGWGIRFQKFQIQISEIRSYI